MCNFVVQKYCTMKKRIDYSYETLSKIISECGNLAQVCRAYGIGLNSSNYKTIRKKIEEYGIDVSHFSRGSSQIGSKNGVKYDSIKEVLIENSPYRNISCMKKRILKEGLLEYKCSVCGITEWNNQPLSLQLDHINGINNDHRIENLRFLCPNCHSQTSTYAGRNVKDKRN